MRLARRVAAAAEGLARNVLPADAPEVLRAVAGVGWRAQLAVCRRRNALMREEARRTFGVQARALYALARESHDLTAQSLLEGAIVPRMTDAELDAILRVRGLVRGPAVVLWATTGPRALLARALARAAGEVTLFRGHAHPRDEARLPVHWEHRPEALAVHAARGCTVGGAWDDRGWGEWHRVPALGRTLLLPVAPFALARARGLPLVHATLVRERDKRWVLTFRPPVAPDPETFARDEALPFVERHPGHWAAWLAHCAAGASSGAPPLFEG